MAVAIGRGHGICKTDFKYFSIGTKHFLGVANQTDGSSGNINSVIYEIEQKKYLVRTDRELLARAYYNLGLVYSKMANAAQSHSVNSGSTTLLCLVVGCNHDQDYFHSPMLGAASASQICSARAASIGEAVTRSADRN